MQFAIGSHMDLTLHLILLLTSFLGSVEMNSIHRNQDLNQICCPSSRNTMKRSIGTLSEHNHRRAYVSQNLPKNQVVKLIKIHSFSYWKMKCINKNFGNTVASSPWIPSIHYCKKIHDAAKDLAFNYSKVILS